jgi:hypothetical protein
VITSPTVNQTVSFPLTIKGYLDVAGAKSNTCNRWGAFEGTAGDIVVKDTNGGVRSLAVKINTVGDYSIGMERWPITATIKNLTGTPYTNQISLNMTGDAQADGEIAATQILYPLIVTPYPPTNTGQKISVYFGNIVSDPGFLDCRVNYPVSRSVPQTQAVARTSLEQLLQGPTTAEYNAGYRTFLGTGITINSLTITNGVAHVDFSTLTGPGGTCGTSGMVSQITNTLKQFPTVTSVKMTVNGQDASIILEGMI